LRVNRGLTIRRSLFDPYTLASPEKFSVVPTGLVSLGTCTQHYVLG
jgi:hypothetical protein